MKKLYVIGNGFDMKFKLPTRVKNFVDELKELSCAEYGSAWDIYDKYGVIWSDFEECIADIILDEIEEDLIEYPDYTSDHESDRDCVIWNANSFTNKLFSLKQEAFEKMIGKAEEILAQKKKTRYADFFENDAHIINFNYTSTIETLFNYNKPIFHIHGYYKSGDDLILGFRKENDKFWEYKAKLNSERNKKLKDEKNLIISNDSLSKDKKENAINELEYCYDQNWNDPYVDKEYETIVDFYLLNKKNFQYEKLKQYLKEIGKIEEIVVLGQSMGDVDSEYFEIIENELKPKSWIVSVRYKKDIIKEKEKFSNYSFHDKIQLKSMKDILSKKV